MIRESLFIAGEIPVLTKVLNRNSPLRADRQTHSFSPLSLSQTHFELHCCMVGCHCLIACCVSQLLLCTAQRAEGQSATGRKRCFRWRRWSPRSEKRSVKVCLLKNPQIHTRKKNQPLNLTHSYTITVAYLCLISDGLHRLKVLYILIICLFAIPVSFLFSTKVRGIQQLTHLSLVSATHKTQRLPNDHKWSRDTICGHACWVCAVGTGTCMYMCACNVKARPPPCTQIYDAETG